jgi:hypothetical protein
VRHVAAIEDIGFAIEEAGILLKPEKLKTTGKVYPQPTCSSCLSDYFLLRSGPGCWRELSDLGDLGRWQAREQILQIIKWIDPMPTATSQQGVDHRTPFASFRMPEEQEILFPESTWPNTVFNEIMPLRDLCRVAA